MSKTFAANFFALCTYLIFPFVEASAECPEKELLKSNPLKYAEEMIGYISARLSNKWSEGTQGRVGYISGLRNMDPDATPLMIVKDCLPNTPDQTEFFDYYLTVVITEYFSQHTISSSVLKVLKESIFKMTQHSHEKNFLGIDIQMPSLRTDLKNLKLQLSNKNLDEFLTLAYEFMSDDPTLTAHPWRKSLKNLVFSPFRGDVLGSFWSDTFTIALHSNLSTYVLRHELRHLLESLHMQSTYESNNFTLARVSYQFAFFGSSAKDRFFYKFKQKFGQSADKHQIYLSSYEKYARLDEVITFWGDIKNLIRNFKKKQKNNDASPETEKMFQTLLNVDLNMLRGILLRFQHIISENVSLIPYIDETQAKISQDNLGVNSLIALDFGKTIEYPSTLDASAFMTNFFLPSLNTFINDMLSLIQEFPDNLHKPVRLSTYIFSGNTLINNFRIKVQSHWEEININTPRSPANPMLKMLDDDTGSCPDYLLP